MTTTHTPADSTAQMESALADFLRRYPTYNQTQHLDELRSTEYGRLDAQGHIYLDYTGGGLHADSQLREHMAMLQDNVFGNPHSINPTSLPMTHLVEQTRRFILEYFNASPEEYVAIFTPNASGALRLVSEAYPFGPDGCFLRTWDNHNSVNGIREQARQKGAQLAYVPVYAPELRADEDELITRLEEAPSGGNNLFAYPAQSNFSGVQHPLEWIEDAQQRGWDVLVDCAAFVPTNRLDLSEYKPDFVPISFYKMFGYPTGLGCLLARKTALKKLQRPWFAGGTILAVSVQGDWHYMLDNWEAFEDGTVNYLGIPAIEIGLRHLVEVGIDAIHERVLCLTGWLLDQMRSLRHANGSPLFVIYGPQDTWMRGGTIACNFLDPRGRIVSERVVEKRAAASQISLRTGCFCNPGAGEAAFQTPMSLLEDAAPGRNSGEIRFDKLLVALGRAVRISTGLASNFADVYKFTQYAHTFLDNENA
jgi:molybdenum cofactor sulfurtransferase